MSHWCRWEYRIETVRHADGTFSATPPIGDYLALVNELGAEGWEVYHLGAGGIHLKRQHPDRAALNEAR